MFTIYVIPGLQFNFDNFISLYFEYYGALPHYITVVQNCVDEVFQWKVIGRGGALEIPPRLPMNFFFWVYDKDKVYVQWCYKLQAIKELNESIYVFVEIYFNKWMLQCARSYDKIYQRIKWK